MVRKPSSERAGAGNLRAGRRWRRWAVAAALALSAFLGLWLLRTPGPQYEGRPLRHWLLLATSPNHQEQLRAEPVLQSLGPEAVPELIRALESRPSRLEGLWARVRERVFRLEPAPDRDRAIAREARLRLGRLGPAASNAVPALLRYGARTWDPLTQQTVAMIGPAGAPHLHAALGSADPQLRAAAAAAAASGVFQPVADEFAPVLTNLLQDTNQGPRFGAIRALAVLAPSRPDIAAAVAGLLEGAEEQTASFVLEHLRDFRAADTGTVDAVRACLNTTAPGLRLAASRALVSLAPPATEVLPVLVALLREPGQQFMAAQTLGEMGPAAAPAIPEMLAQLETAATHRPSRTPDFTAIALGRVGPLAMPGLVGLLDHPSSDVRVNAAAAVKGQGPAGVPAVPALIRMLSAEDLEEQMAAASALGAVGPGATAAIPELTRLAALETTQDVIVGHVRSAARDALERIRIPAAGD